MTDRSATRLYRRMNRGRISFNQYFDILWNTGAQYDRGQYLRIMKREIRWTYGFMTLAGGWYVLILAAWFLDRVPFWVWSGVSLATMLTFGAMNAAVYLRIRHLDRDD